MKLMIHELQAAIAHVRADALEPCFKILARVKLIQKQLFEQWAVLETLTPSEYEAFRPALGTSSGFQSAQYRAIEFLLGNKHARDARRVPPRPAGVRRARRAAARAVALRRIPAPSRAPRAAGAAATPRARRHAAVRARSRSRAGAQDRSTTTRRTGGTPTTCARSWSTSRRAFQLWRFRHMKTVERIIGHKPGTGGSSGVAFLQPRARAVVLSRADRRAHGDRRAMNSGPNARSTPARRVERFADRRGGRGARRRAADRSRARSARRAALLARAAVPAPSASISPIIRSAVRSTRRSDDVREGLAAWYARWAARGTPGWPRCDAYRARLARLLHAPRADCVVPKTSAGQGLRAVLNTYDSAPRVVATRGEFDSLDVILREYARRGRIALDLGRRRAPTAASHTGDIVARSRGASISSSCRR